MTIEDGVSSVSTSSSSGSSFSLYSQVHDDKRDDISPEDAAWVDSCLIKESEFFDNSWDSMKDALLEVLNSPESLSDKSPKDNDVEMLTLVELVEPDQSQKMDNDETEGSQRTPFSLLPNNKEAESSSDSFPIHDVGDSQSIPFVGNPFLPSYVEGSEETIQITVSRSDSSSSVSETEPSSDEIFRVWDLNVPAEENELSVQLKKILEVEENDTHSKPYADSGAREDLKGVSLDNLIESIANISLGRDSTRWDEN